MREHHIAWLLDFCNTGPDADPDYEFVLVIRRKGDFWVAEVLDIKDPAGPCFDPIHGETALYAESALSIENAVRLLDAICFQIRGQARGASA